MILRRLGNKSNLAEVIINYFPPHKTYIEPFFGAGGMFFNKPRAEHNILNDIDADVFNLFITLQTKKELLLQKICITPISEDLIKYWIKNKEQDDILKAVRFLFLSNFTLNGSGNSLRTNAIENSKKEIEDNINATFNYIKYCRFYNKDFRKLIKSIAYRQDIEKNNTFIYCDPPYLNTNDNYSDSFKEKDSLDLFDSLEENGCKWAMSEFDNDFIIKEAQKRGLNINIIGERKNLKNRRIEILITNYKNAATLF